MAYLFKRGKVWYMAYQKDGRWVRESANTVYKDVARGLLRQRELQAATNQGDPEPIPFRDFAVDYLADKKKIGRKAVDRDEDSLELHLIPFFRGKKLGEITAEMVDRYIAHRRSGGAALGTIQRELVCLKHLLNLARRWGKIRENPAAGVSVPGANVRRRRVLFPEEIQRLLEECSPQARDAVQVALYQGLRKGEIRNLKEQDCDFLREEIYLRVTKSGEPRIIPMHPQVKEILWRRMQGIEDRTLFSPAFHRGFDGAVRRAGLRDVRFHDLRRTCASYLAMEGVSPKAIQEILGHRDIRMTMDVYTHVSRSHLREAIERLRIPSATTQLATHLDEKQKGGH